MRYAFLSSVLATGLFFHNALAAPIVERDNERSGIASDASITNPVLAVSASGIASPVSTGASVSTPFASSDSTAAASTPASTGTSIGAGTDSSAELPSIASSYTVSTYASLSAAASACTALSLSSLTVPADTTLDLTKLKAGAIVVFEGTTSFTFSSSMTADLIKVTGKGVNLLGAPGHVIDGNGGAWWDGQSSNGGVDKPDHFITLSKLTNSSVVRDLNIQNWPVHCFQITGCSDLTIRNINLDNSAGDAPNAASGGRAAAHNSDGFDISSSTNVLLTGSTVRNQGRLRGRDVGLGHHRSKHGLRRRARSLDRQQSAGNRTTTVREPSLFRNSQIADSEDGAIGSPKCHVLGTRVSG